MAANDAGRRPNILLFMFDQMAAASLPCYGHPLVHAPNLSALAARGVVFDSAYSNSPLCSPARYAMLTGRLPSRIGAYDNAAELPSSLPTLLHYLRAGGYRTCLAGKMDFTGADQLHGFEERLTTDLTPADFGWTPEWDSPEKVQPWYHSLECVADAGPCERTLAMEYDEEACFQAARWLYAARRHGDDRPFLLAVSCIQPHDPYLAPAAEWALYDDEAIDMPAVPWIAPEARDPHSRRLWALYDRGEYRITGPHVRRARHGYYAMISWIDRKVGQVLQALETAGFAEDTVVIATADQGDMLGERGLWFKMCFFERAIRVPLVISWPRRLAARRVGANVSLVDLMATVMEIAGAGPPAVPLEGNTLMSLARGGGDAAWPDAVHAEHLGEGTTQPLFMIRRGQWKYVCCEGDPPQLYDLAADPLELANLAGLPEHAAVAAAFAAEAGQRWDGAAIRAAVLDSQRQRLVVQRALLSGRAHPWDYTPPADAARRYYRNTPDALFATDRPARIPSRPAPARDGGGSTS
jgi:choline-sulfatase